MDNRKKPSSKRSDQRAGLKERYGAPPFSVLDARQTYWQQRKRAWKALGLRSHLGRDADMGTMCHLSQGTSPDLLRKFQQAGPTTSVFDPVLCELLYRWFCPRGGVVLDPFAGGSVRGVVAALLGRRYLGIDLRPEQVEANRRQWEEISAGLPAAPSALPPEWTAGDSREVLRLARGRRADFVFSCPPNFDLERYSDDPRDLSAMHYVDFVHAYRRIVADSLTLLEPDRFACFVVGDIRDGKGFYRNFPGQTIAAFESAGAKLYNDAVLVTSAGTLALRAGRPFESTRKLGKGHQNVLIFSKGDPRRATAALGPVETPGDCPWS